MDRKATYKLPPTSVTQPRSSQQLRRDKALSEQKRKRAQKIDVSRHLDAFGDLNLAASDDEQDQVAESHSGTKVVHTGLAAFATSLADPDPGPGPSSVPIPAVDSSSLPSSFSSKKLSPNSKRHRTRRVKKDRGTSEWADKCMYAELLEMSSDDPWSDMGHDGLPDDLETAWVALAPVPVGKRCLAITRDSPGHNGAEPNTTLRSRLLGKPLLPWFPSPLPPSTVLDCILDENWRETGVLHVLDVLKWKGQDIADCEAKFRFWWRDTRLDELASMPPPQNISSSPYSFPYPNTLLPVQHHTDLSLSSLLSCIIPLARTTRTMTVQTPISFQPDSSMDVDIPSSEKLISLAPDGLLLYVAEATYESGTSPLSSWIPLHAYEDSGAEGPLDKFERLLQRRNGDATMLRDIAMS